MLGKLIKHEFKGSAHFMKMAYMSLGILCVFIFLMWLSDVDFLGSILSAFLVAGAFATLMFTFVMIAVRYAVNFYGEGSHIMFMLPCSRGSVLISRFFVSYIWSIVAEAVLVFSFFAVKLYADSTLNAEIANFVDGLLIFKDFSVTFIVFAVVTLLVLPAYLIYSVYFSVSFSHLAVFAKYRKAVALSTFFILNALAAIFTITFMLKIPFAVQMSDEGISFTGSNLAGYIARKMPLDQAYIGISGIIFLLIVAVALHFVTKKLVKSRVAI